MKRLFTLFAAMCCMVSVALAEFADGVKISICGVEVEASEQACFQSAKITAGHMSYDPTYHILYVVGAHVETSDALAYAVAIEGPANPDFTVKIQLCKSDAEFFATGSMSAGLFVNFPVEVRGYQRTLTCKGKKDGLLLSGAPLTLTGGIMLDARGENYGVRGFGETMPKLTINRGFLRTYTSGTGTKDACMSEVDLAMEGCAITAPSGAEYNAEKGTIEKSGALVHGTYADITWQGTLIYVYPAQKTSYYGDMTGIIGSYAITKGDKEQSNPSTHAYEDVLNVSFVDGPDVKNWDLGSWDGTGYKIEGDASSATITVDKPVVSLATKFVDCYYKVALKNKMHVLLNSSGTAELYETTNCKDLDYLPSMPSSADKATNITFANDGTDGAGNMYYSIEDASKSQIKKVAWIVYKEDYDGAEVFDATALQSDYYPFAGLSYNWVDGKLYGVAKKSSKWYLVEVKPNTKAISSIGELDGIGSYAPIALACDKYGDVYCMAYSTKDPLLFKVSKTDGKVTKFAHPGFNLELIDGVTITAANVYKYNAMQFDYETNDLYWRTSFYDGTTSATLVIDMATGHAKQVQIAPSDSWNVGMFQELPKSYTITAKTAEGNYGTTLVEGKSSFKALEGSTVTLTAKGDDTEGTVFKQWKDGNKENPRKVEVTEAATYEAEYWYGEGVEMYPIWVCGKQFHAKRLGFNSTNLPTKLTAGEIAYDPDNKLLTLDKAAMNISASEIGILVGEEESATELTIKSINNESAITGTLSFVPLRLVNAQVTMTGDKKLTWQGAGCGVSLTKGSTLKIEGAADVLLKGSYAISADETSNKLEIRGSKVVLFGSSKATYQLAEATSEYCTITPSDAIFNPEKGNYTKGETSTEYSNVSFAVDGYTVRCEPTEEGTGSFTLALSDGTGETFKNVGWFKKDAKVTITATPAEGHAFGYWTDDTKLEYSREISVSGNVTKQARFFREVESGATWYGVHGGKLASFSIYEFGKEVVNPKKCFPVSNVKAGDFVDGNWVYVDGSSASNMALKSWAFEGSFDKDTEYETTENKAGVDTIVKAGTAPVGITDYAYDLMGGEQYGVAGTALYRLNEGDKKLENIATLKNKYMEGGVEKTKTVTGICIAFNASSEMFILSLDNILYKMSEIDTENKEAWLEIVGDEKKGGNIKELVSNTQQSLAFDHVTGELFWAAGDYIRLIDTEEMKCHIVADLGFKKGSAGVVKAMHCMDAAASVKAQVAESCAGMGTVVVGNGKEGDKSSGSFIAGTKVTITAKPATGYKFVKWTIKSGKTEKDVKNGDKSQLEVSASGSTYIAYFEATQGLDDVNSDELTVKKVIRDGQIYIIKGEKMYNMTGNRVK